MVYILLQHQRMYQLIAPQGTARVIMVLYRTRFKGDIFHVTIYSKLSSGSWFHLLQAQDYYSRIKNAHEPKCKLSNWIFNAYLFVFNFLREPSTSKFPASIFCNQNRLWTHVSMHHLF